MTSLVITLALLLVRVVACCDDVDHPSSCWATTNPAELEQCDPAAELADCEVLDGVTIGCAPIELSCCEVETGVVWLDACKPLEPGGTCAAAVVGKHVAES